MSEAGDGGRVLETERLTLRRISTEDAGFILELLNDPSWLRFIGDRGVRTPDDARRYILKGPVASYARHGFGLYLVERKGTAAPLGICGLVRREGLEGVDVGFAFLPPHRGKGYALEAAAAVMSYGRRVLGLTRILAITALDNERSIRLLEKLGLRFERRIVLPGEAEEIALYSSDGGLPPQA